MGTMEDGHLTSIKGMMKKILAILVILAVPAVAFTAPPFVDTEPVFRVITVACEKQPEQELHAPGITRLSPDGDIVIAPQAEIKCRITGTKNYYDGTEYITTNTVICTDGKNWVRAEW